MKRRLILTLFLALVSLSIVRAGPDIYNPLAVGLKWEVDVEATDPKGAKTQGSVVREVIGTDTINGLTYFVVNTSFSGLPDMKDFTTYRRKTVKAIYAINGLDKTKQEFLEAVLPLTPGQSWKTTVFGQIIETSVQSKEPVTIGDKTYPDCMKLTYRSRDQKLSGTSYQAPDIGAVLEETTSGTSKFKFTLKKFSGLK